jgi:hypothetical protein
MSGHLTGCTFTCRKCGGMYQGERAANGSKPRLCDLCERIQFLVDRMPKEDAAGVRVSRTLPDVPRYRTCRDRALLL